MVTDEQIRLVKLRDKMRVFAGAYSALDQLLQQVHECLVNNSMDQQDAMRFYWTALDAQRALTTARIEEVQKITENVHNDRRALMERWVQASTKDMDVGSD